MFIIIIIKNGAKTISLQTSFGDLIRNRANTMSPETSFGGHNKKRSKHNKI
jgi:hypothetical protein